MPEPQNPQDWPEEAVERVAMRLYGIVARSVDDLSGDWGKVHGAAKNAWKHDARVFLNALSKHLVPASRLSEVEVERDEWRGKEIAAHDGRKAAEARANDNGARAEQAEKERDEAEQDWRDAYIYSTGHMEAMQAKLEEAQRELGELEDEMDSANVAIGLSGAKLEEVRAALGEPGAAADVGRLRAILDSNPPQPQEEDCEPDPNHGKLTGVCCEDCGREQRVGDEGWESREGVEWCPDCFVEDVQPEPQGPRCGTCRVEVGGNHLDECPFSVARGGTSSLVLADQCQPEQVDDRSDPWMVIYGDKDLPIEHAEEIAALVKLAHERMRQGSSEVACDRPPDGWHCTREPGHDGPCAAVPAPRPSNPNQVTEERHHYRGLAVSESNRLFALQENLGVEIDGLERLANEALGGDPKRALLASVGRLRGVVSESQQEPDALPPPEVTEEEVEAADLKPAELAKALGIQLWTPVHQKGKGVGMKQTDDGFYIDLGDLPRALQAAHRVSQPSGGDSLRTVAEQAHEAIKATAKALIALEGTLKQPYTDDPRWSPWTRFVDRNERSPWRLLCEADTALRMVLSQPSKGGLEEGECPDCGGPVPCECTAHEGREP